MSKKTKSPKIRSTHLGSKGLYNKDGDLICRRVEVVSIVDKGNNSTEHIILKLQNKRGEEKTCDVRHSDLRKPGPLVDALLDAGLDVPSDDGEKKDLIKYIRKSAQAIMPVRSVQRIGWHGDRFVLPKAVIGEKANEIVYEGDPMEDEDRFDCAGTLREWKEHVGRPAKASSRIMLSICMPFAAPLLKFTSRTEGGGIHFYGLKGSGKTTSLISGQSVMGPAGLSDIPTWNASSKGLEELGPAHCDTSMNLDELGTLGAGASSTDANLRNFTFTAANGRSKILSKNSAYATSPEASKWRLLYMSSGVNSVAEHTTKRSMRTVSGEAERLVDLPVDAGKGYGNLEKLPAGLPSGAALNDQIAKAARIYYGTPFRAYLEMLVKRTDELDEYVADIVDQFKSNPKVKSLKGFDERVTNRFGLMYAGGLLGIDAKILPWSKRSLLRAILRCYRAAWSVNVDPRFHMQHSAMKAIRRLAKDKEIRDLRKSNPKGSITEKDAVRGFMRATPKGEIYFGINEEKFRKLARVDIDWKLVISELETLGMLIRSKARSPGNSQLLVGTGKKKIRFLYIKADAVKSALCK